jgi:GTP-binding protein
MLLPSAAWQAAQTWEAMLCALPAASCAKACAANTAAAAPHSNTRIIPWPPRIVERRDFIRLFPQAQFLASAARPADLPPPGPPELAFVGRSNVGKSSAINALAGRKRLAFTSKTPGRTQTINFFSLGETARLTDLPGYGYAKVPHTVRRQWQELIGAYLKSRASLVGVVVIMDARHPLTPLDAQLLEWLGAARILVLLSKADKLSRVEQAATLKHVSEETQREVRLFSSVSKQGVEECRDLLESWLEQAAEIKSPR